MSPGRWLTAIIVLPMVAVSCGGPEEAANAPASPTAAETEEPLTPEESRAAERRAERRAEREERCSVIRSMADVRYEITSVPTADGPEVRLHIVVDNRTHQYLGGSTSGLLKLPPGRGFREINWGGSSADILGVRRRTVHRGPIYHSSVRPGIHPVSDRVLWFDVETSLNDDKVACEMTVRVEAPPGLVDGHPGGTWVIPADKSWRIGPDQQ